VELATGSGWPAEVEWAYRLGRSLLCDVLPRRWMHSLGVGRRAVECGSVVGDDVNVLVAAALLHDVGYVPDLATTGLHPLDGARHLRTLGVDEHVVRLVAYHSCAELEAELRGLEGELAEFERPDAPCLDVLTYCDMTTTPDGQRTDADSRLAEIVQRSGEDSVVGRFISRARPEIKAKIARVEGLVRGNVT
jgi:putative nucleotidyltransferase with HDIG domain